MSIRIKTYTAWTGLFFCTTGWVYAASVNQADVAKSPEPASVVTAGVGHPAATQPTQARIENLSPDQLAAAKDALAAAERHNAGATAQPANDAFTASPASAAATQPTSTTASAHSPRLAGENGNTPPQASASAAAATPVADAPAKVDLPQGQTVQVGTFGKINLHVQDLDLTKVLQLLSIESHKNIIASRDVSGKVSADLYGVNFYDALDAILHTNGFGYVKKGNFIYVYTAAELAQIQKASRQMVHAVVRLNYITAADASKFVSPLLSSSGSIAVSGAVTAGFQPSMSDGGANSFANPGTLVIYDYPQNVSEIQEVLKKLDVRPLEVLVEATILQAELTNKDAFGVDFSIFTHLNPADLTNPLSAVDNLISGAGAGGAKLTGGRAIQTNVGGTASPSSIKVGIVGSDAAVFVHALDSVTDTTVLANPKILVLNRQKAELLIGKKLGYLSTTQTTTAATSTVQFLDVGTQLTLRPFISTDGYVRLELKPSVSTGDTTRVVGGQVIPTSDNQELTTNIMVHSGQTVVLGGLFTQNNTTNHNQVPGLASVPLIGAAFQGHDDTVDRSEVIFLIKPTIVKDHAMAQAGMQATQDIKDIRLGAREDLLPWAQDKLTESYMRDAIKYMQQGDKTKALWSVNHALSIDPRMVSAMKLKEKITGQKLYFHDRSRSNNIVNDMVNQELQSNKHSDTHSEKH